MVFPDTHTEGEVVWSSDDTSVLTVTSRGINTATYTAMGAGTATITAAVGNASYSLNVILRDRVPATAISIANNTRYIATTNKSGSPTTGTLIAGVFPENHTDGKVEWSSDDESVITVTSRGINTATYTAVGVGTATITASVGDVSNTLKVILRDGILALNILIAGNTTQYIATTNKDGSPTTGTLTAVVLPDNHNDGDVQWSSDDTNIITVTKENATTATYTAVGVGTATITAAVGNASHSLKVILRDRVPAIAIAIAGNNPLNIFTKTPEGWATTGTLAAGVFPDDHTDGEIMWSSDDESVITVTKENANMASYTAVGAGTATITAAVGNVSYVLKVMVFISATNIAIAANNPLFISITNEDGSSNTGTLTAMVIPTNHTDGEVVWSSDDESVITVTHEYANTASYTAVGAGTATITASVGNVSQCARGNGFYIGYQYIAIAANNPLFISITNEDGSSNTGTLTATVTPTNHTDGEVVWSSDDESVITVTHEYANTG